MRQWISEYFEPLVQVRNGDPRFLSKRIVTLQADDKWRGCDSRDDPLHTFDWQWQKSPVKEFFCHRSHHFCRVSARKLNRALGEQACIGFIECLENMGIDPTREANAKDWDLASMERTRGLN